MMAACALPLLTSSAYRGKGAGRVPFPERRRVTKAPCQLRARRALLSPISDAMPHLGGTGPASVRLCTPAPTLPGRTTGIIRCVRPVVVWLRLVSGMSVGLLLLAMLPAAAAPHPGEPVLRRVMLLLALLGFALGAAGWGLGARWGGLGRVVRGGGELVFGLAMLAYVVAVLQLPGWLGWALFGLFATAGVAVSVWLHVDRGRDSPAEPDPLGRLEVPVARLTTLMMAVLAAALATTALVLLPVPVLGWLVGGAGVLFFGGSCVWLVVSVVRPGPAIRADSQGMEDRSSLVAAGWISWSELSRIRGTSAFGQPTVALTPRDWATVVGRQVAWRRALLALNRRLTRSDDLLVNVNALPCSANDLANTLEEMRRENTPAGNVG